MTESLNSSPEPVSESVEWLRAHLSTIRENEIREIPSDPETLLMSLDLDSLDIITTVEAVDFSDLIERLLDKKIPPILPLSSRPFKNSYHP